MPTPVEVAAESYSWSVRYEPLVEAERCPETGGAHVWACRAHARVCEVTLTGQGVEKTIVVPPGWGPVFFRRRSVELDLANGTQTRGETVTYFGIERGPDRILYAAYPGGRIEAAEG